MKPDNNPPLRSGGRVILHLDMNAFYCSVHEAEQPELYKGKPCAVAGSVELRRGIVVTASYPARAKGVRAGLQVRKALQLCPELILIQPDFNLYRKYSQLFLKIAYNYSPLVEAVSIDECFVDITGSGQFGTAEQIAGLIQSRVRDELGLPCSIGIAPNKLLAKMASDMKKPNGMTILRIRDVPDVLWEKPCAELFGIGNKTAEKLAKLNIQSIGQLAQTEEGLLTQHFGIMGSWLKLSANGIDRSPVHADREQSKSIGHTTTLPRDATDKLDIQRIFLNLADQVARRLRRQKLVASTIQITIRKPDMGTITRSFTLASPTENMEDIYRESCRLFETHWKQGNPVRLLGIAVQNLAPKVDSAIQLDLFNYGKQPQRERLTVAMDKIRDKFGEGAILTAGMMNDDPSALIRNHKIRGTSLQMDHIKQMNLDEEG